MVKNPVFVYFFPNLEILCPIDTFVLLPIISSTETISEQFLCKLEKMLYRSLKFSPAGKDGFIVKVRHVLLTLSLYISLKKIFRTVYKNNDQIKFSTDFPF